MSYLIAFLITLLAGWSVTACDALFRAEERPGLFHGPVGLGLLLVFAAAGGLVLAGAVIWVLRIVPSASIALMVSLGAFLGAWASNRLNVTPAGAANRMLVGLAGLIVLYGIAWSYYPPP